MAPPRGPCTPAECRLPLRHILRRPVQRLQIFADRCNPNLDRYAKVLNFFGYYILLRTISDRLKRSDGALAGPKPALHSFS